MAPLYGFEFISSNWMWFILKGMPYRRRLIKKFAIHRTW